EAGGSYLVKAAQTGGGIKITIEDEKTGKPGGGGRGSPHEPKKRLLQPGAETRVLQRLPGVRGLLLPSEVTLGEVDADQHAPLLAARLGEGQVVAAAEVKHRPPAPLSVGLDVGIRGDERNAVVVLHFRALRRLPVPAVVAEHLDEEGRLQLA